MRRTFVACFGLAAFLAAEVALGQAVPLDVRDLRPGPVEVTAAEEGVTVEWPDAADRDWRATFSLDPDRPLNRVDLGGRRDGRVGGAAVLPGRDRNAAARVERVLRLSAQPPRRNAPQSGRVRPDEGDRPHRRRAGRAGLRRAAHGGVRGRDRIHHLSGQSPHPAGGGGDDRRSRRRLLLRRGLGDGRRRRPRGRRQHAEPRELVRHRRRPAPRRLDRASTRSGSR